MPDIEFVLCANCGERIYMMGEKLNNFRDTGNTFQCIYGHGNFYTTSKTNKK